MIDSLRLSGGASERGIQLEIRFFTEDSDFLLFRLSVARRENYEIIFLIFFQRPGMGVKFPIGARRASKINEHKYCW